MIEEDGDGGRMEVLLDINDQLTNLLTKVPRRPIGLGLVTPTTNGVGSVAVGASPHDEPHIEPTGAKKVEEIGTTYACVKESVCEKGGAVTVERRVA